MWNKYRYWQAFNRTGIGNNLAFWISRSPAMTRLPSLYISHGSPMTALTPGLVGVRLAELAARWAVSR